MTRSPFPSVNRLLIVALVFAITGGQCFGLTRTRKRRVHTALQAAVIPASTTTTATIAPPAHRMALQPAKPAGVSEPVIAGGPWTEPTYADSTLGDNVDGEDLDIRRAAVEALGPYNGSVVVVDPNSGRILSMVNQRLALGSGFQPCSTIKVSVALAGLNEKAIEPNVKVKLGGMRIDLTY